MARWYETYQNAKFGGYGLTQTDQEEEEDKNFGVFDYVKDVAMGVPRGLEGAVQDVYGLADTLTGDALPDYESRLFGESQTVVGGISEGIVNFAAGFVPVLGWMGKGAKVGRSLTLAKGLSKGAQKAAARAGMLGLPAKGAKVAGLGGKQFSPMLGEAGIDVTRAALAGAITDFAVFDGHEARLSNLIQQFPQLANPVTEFLAADESDTEIEGRLKAMIEGIGVGAVVDTFILSLKHFRGYKHARARGASAKEAEQEADDLVHPAKISSALESSRGSTHQKDPFSFARLVEDEDFLVTRKGAQKGTYSGTIGIEGKPGLTKPEQLTHIRNLVMMGAEQGSVGKEWYERSGRELLKLTGGNIDEADKIAQLVAVFSPQTGIEENFERALKAYYWSKRVNRTTFMRQKSSLMGETNSAWINTEGMQKQAAKILYDGEWLPDIVRKIGATGKHVKREDGRKISNFYNDIMSGIDPTRERVKGATMDMWMSRYFGFAPKLSKDGGAAWEVSGTQYDYMQRTIRDVAQELGWEQHQAQAAVWSYAKTLWESMEEEVIALATDRGIKPSAKGNFNLKTNHEYGVLYLEQFQKRLNVESGASKRFKAGESFDLSSLLRDRAIVLPDTSLPSPGSGVLENLHHASWEEKVQYEADMELVRVGDEGQDLIEEALGFGGRTLDPNEGPGLARLLPAPPATKGDLKTRIKSRKSTGDPVAIKQAKAYAMVEGLYHNRGIVEGVQVFRGQQITKAASNGFEIHLGRRRSDNDLEVIQNAVTKVFGRRKIVVVPLDNGFVLVTKNKGAKFVDEAQKVIDNLALPKSKPSGNHVFAEHFQLDSKANDGSGFRALLEEQGYGEALKRLDDVYRPNVTKIQQKYQGKGFGNAPRNTDSAAEVRIAADSRRGDAVSGSALDRNAARLEDLDGRPVPLNSDGTVTLYHRTSKESAQRILDTGTWVSKENEAASYFSSLEHGHAKGHGTSVVSVKIDPAKVELDDAFRDGEVHVKISNEDLADVQVVGAGRDLFTPDEIAAVTKTARVWKITATAKAARRLAPDFMPEGGTVLDFGAGKQTTPDKYYGKGLVDDGYDVTLYDFSENTGPMHNPEALGDQYDMVMASNVLNVQSSEDMLDMTLDQLSRSVNKDGRVIANFPGTPRKGAFAGMSKTDSAEFLREKLLERFAKVERVGGTKAEPVFMASGKLSEPHVDGLLNPKIETAAPGIGQMRQALAGQGYDLVNPDDVDVLVGLVHRRYGGEILESGGTGPIKPTVKMKKVEGEYPNYTITVGDKKIHLTKADDWEGNPEWFRADADNNILDPDGSTNKNLTATVALEAETKAEAVALLAKKIGSAGEPGHRWNRLPDGTEVDLNSGLKDGNGWDPAVTEGTVRVLPEDALNHVEATVKDLDERLSADALNTGPLAAFADSKKLDAIDEDTQRQLDELYPEGLTPEDIAAKKRGMKEIFQRLRLQQFKIKNAAKKATGNLSDYKAQTAAQELDDADIYLLDRFMRHIGEEMFSEVHLTIRSNDSIEGRFDYLNDIVTLSTKALREGEFQHTMFHELWHHLSRYVDDATVGKLKKQFTKERDAYFKKNPDAKQRIADEKWTPEEYRYRDVDEWFAEVMAEKSLDRIALMDASSKSLFVHAKRVVLEMIAAIKAKFGIEHTQKMLDDFMSRGVAGKGQPRLPGQPGSSRHRSFDMEGSTEAFAKKGKGKRGRRRKQQAEPEDARVGLLRPLGLKEDVARIILKNIDQRLSAGYELGINPREKIKNPDGSESYKYSKSELLERHLERSDLNLSHYSGPEDAISVLRTYEDLFRSVIEEDVEALKTKSYFDQMNAAREQLGKMVGTTSRDDQALQLHIMRGIADDNRQLAEINARILAYKSVQQTMGKLIFEDIKAYRATGGKGTSEAAQVAIHFHAEFMANLTAGIKGLTALQGRGLGSGNIAITGVLEDPKQLESFLQMRGGKKGTDRLVRILETSLTDGKMDADGIGRVNRMLKPSFSRQIMNITNEYWINSILSGGKTLFINGLGGVLISIYRPLESMLGASVTLNGAAFSDAVAELGYLFVHANDAFKMAWQAAKMGENILDPKAKVLDLPNKDFQAISPKGFGMKEDSLMGTGVTWLGNTLRIPSRILTSTDEFFKQINYRAKAHRSLMREGMTMGKNGDELASHIHDRLSIMVEDGQAYSAATAYNRGVKAAHEAGLVDPVEIRDYAQKHLHLPPEKGGFDHALNTLSKEALDVSEEVTFTRSLDSGSASAWLQRLTIQSPWMRFIVPFVRTPVNIATFAAQRYDFIGGTRWIYAKMKGEHIHLKDAQNRMMRDLSSGDPRKVSDAAGRASAGFMASLILYAKATEGKMTGRGPSDPELRQILRDAGWQPYSIKTEEGYVSYARLDPFATVMGTMADIHDHIRYSDMEDQEDSSTALMGLAIALSQNFTNKTYLAGLSNVLQALDAPDRFMPKLSRTYAASMIPFSSFQGQSLYAFGDEYMRDVQSMTEALMAKTPYYSDQVRPLRNFLGEEVRRTTAAGTDTIGSVMDLFFPVAYTQFTNDALKQEFVTLGHGFTPPKPRKNGLNLTDYLHPLTGQDAFDRWQQLNGTVRVGGRTLRSSLLSLLKSAKYQRLTPLSDFQARSPRIGEIKKVLERYKAKAFDQLLKEYPQLAVDHAGIFDVNRLRKRGIVAGGL